MRKIRLSRLITMGEIDRYLLDVRQGWDIHSQLGLLPNIDSLNSELVSLKFKVTVEAAADLLELATELRATPPGAKISASDAPRLTRIMDRLRHTLKAEAKTLNAYVLNEKKFDVLKLVADPASFLASETFEKLPRIAQLDIREAGKCIAFELPTAGAFHLLRAVEDSLRAYYKLFFKRAKIDKALWGQLITDLRGKRRKPIPSETLLNHLDHIRKNFRNPTDHPDMVYDMDGVQDLFSLVLDVLNRLAKVLPERAKEFDIFAETRGALDGQDLLSALAAIPPISNPAEVASPSGSNTDEIPSDEKEEI
jgi:hypothetical protein